MIQTSVLCIFIKEDWGLSVFAVYTHILIKNHFIMQIPMDIHTKINLHKYAVI
jgi:hypothetical protein